MNKSDKLLIITLLAITLIIIFIMIFNNKSPKIGEIYYDNKLILKVDLTKNKQYKVKGYNGEVIIIVKNNKIKVQQENSPLNLCSKQGYIEKTYQMIVCLPNKIIVKIKEKSDIDTIVK